MIPMSINDIANTFNEDFAIAAWAFYEEVQRRLFPSFAAVLSVGIGPFSKGGPVVRLTVSHEVRNAFELTLPSTLFVYSNGDIILDRLVIGPPQVISGISYTFPMWDRTPQGNILTGKFNWEVIQAHLEGKSNGGGFAT